MSESKDQVQYFLINTDINAYKKRHFKTWAETGYAYLTAKHKPDSIAESGSTSDPDEIFKLVEPGYYNDLKKLKIGDYIFAYDIEFEKVKGYIVGIGRVLEEWDGVLNINEPHPYFRPDEWFYKVRVEWIAEKTVSYEKIKEAKLHITAPAIRQIKNMEVAKKLLLLSELSNTTNPMASKTITMHTDIPLNQILYGPPGTGKTFNTINKALAILDPDCLADAKDRTDLKARFDQLVKEDKIRFVTFHQSFSYEDFVEGLRADNDESGQLKYRVEDGVFKLLCDQARAPLETNDSPSESAAPALEADKKFPYVLIIDEINRGNVSRIFGELITLIEDSKRSGQPEALEVILPYSKTRFSVPDNVYIIGTMNTTDRSLAGMDIALRRRFTFKEMPPRPEELSGVMVEGVDIAALLTTMNQRIEVLLDRDHCLGHSYFLTLKGENNNSLAKLSTIFRHQILPLLKEYFFEDWERIHWVLNDHRKADSAMKFVKQADNNLNTLLDIGPDIPTESRRWELNESAFDKIKSYSDIIKA